MNKSGVGMLRVTQVRSSAHCVEKQILSLKGLGLGRIGKSALVQDNDCVRGLIRKGAHLVSVEAA